MTKNQRIQSFEKLGAYLLSDESEISALLTIVAVKNPWYTPENVRRQFQAIAQNLTATKLNEWTTNVTDEESDKTVALVLAGNIPLVGFHDILCVLISGFNVQIKPSSDDAGLTAWLLQTLIDIEPAFAAKIKIVERLEAHDLIIATGSNNSARYFDYYFGKKPHIIRKNRNSVAVITGNETVEELAQLGHDIFDYFGLGCRSVSKLFIPANYDIARFYEPIEGFEDIIQHHKYVNNYDYNKSIMLINGDVHFDNGFLLLKEDDRWASPLAVVHFSRYEDLAVVKTEIDADQENIQCVVSSENLHISAPNFRFGDSQCPALDDYADGIDVLAFLSENR